MHCNFCGKNIKEKLSYKTIFKKKDRFELCDECKEIISINETRIYNYKLYYYTDYENIKDEIYQLKYFGDVEEIKKFSRLFEIFFELHKFDVVTVVPSNKTRESIRGYNHVELICRLCGVKYELLLDCRYREKQAKLHEKRKKSNFSLIDKSNCYKDKKILIIDDICTSGNTLCSCAQTLERSYKDCEISFLTLALANK